MHGILRTRESPLVISEEKIIAVLIWIVGTILAAFVSLCVWFVKKAFSVYEDVILIKNEQKAVWKNIEELRKSSRL